MLLVPEYIRILKSYSTLARLRNKMSDYYGVINCFVELEGLNIRYQMSLSDQVTLLNIVRHAYQMIGNQEKADELERIIEEVLKEKAEESLPPEIAFHPTVLRYNSDEYHALLRYFNDTLSAFHQTPSEDARSHLFCSIVYYAIGEVKQAKDALNKVLTLTQEGESYWLRATACGILGNLRYQMSEYTGALDEYAQAEKLAEQFSNSKKFLAKIYGNMGNAYYNLNLYQEAIQQYKAMVDIAKGENEHELQIKARIAIGNCHYGMGNFDDALANYTMAIENLSNDPEHNELLAIINVNIGNVYYKQKEYKQALDYQKLAHQSVTQDENLKVWAISKLNMGELELLLGNNEKAIEYCEDALKAIADKPLLESKWRAYYYLGKAYEAKGIEDTAVEEYEKAIQIIEDIRAVITEDTQKASFIANKMDVYERMISLLFNRGEFAKALYYCERAKARAFLDLLGGAEIGGQKKLEVTTQQLIREQHRASIQVSNFQSEGALKLSELDKFYPTDESTTLVERLSKVVQEQQQIATSLRLANPEEAFMRNITPLNAEQIQALLPEDTVILEYYLGKEIALAFAITQNRVVSKILPLNSVQITRRVERFRQRVNTSLNTLQFQSFQEVSSDLYKGLIAPVESELEGKTRICIVPHGILHHLPFSALIVTPDNREDIEFSPPEFLIQKYMLFYSPSASVLQYACNKNPHQMESILAFGNPKYPEGWQTLKESEAEAEEIAKQFNREPLIGEEAKEQIAKRDSSNVDVLHFATHGVLNQQFPLESKILLSKGDEEDGNLTVAEVFNLDLHAYLVALSACETGKAQSYISKGKFPAGDDLVGLSRAFIYAGTPSVIATLWQVNDKSTRLLMEQFYKELKDMKPSERDKAKALQNAQIALLHSVEGSQYRHPFFWAPFILVGDWR
jgi:CHAT domain-containing protein/tetratricopeptide (TPR) repeat protein